MPRLNRSNIIGFVATSNAESARGFYEEILGMRFVSGDDFALVFDANGTMIRVQKVDKVEPHPYTALGWQVWDIQKEVKSLTKRGVMFERYDGMKQDKDGVWTAPSKAKIAWFKDPDGNILSLTEFR